MDCTDAGAPGEFLLVARRNNSLSSAGRALVFASLVILCFAISVAFAFHGAWLVLPFAGAEMLVLFVAFRCIERHAGDFESIAIKGDRVLLERWETGRASRFEFNRFWAQVVVHRSAPGHVTLALRSHGREVEFGRHLTEEQRGALASTLSRQLRSGG
ncbi:MAG TPA: DUF2244 domain-containing protein [Burkholderiales bacterium]|nr:DUF2244 domain-containing protein [Burkholderiales bacterium]